jgi:hypothetical protein
MAAGLTAATEPHRTAAASTTGVAVYHTDRSRQGSAERTWVESQLKAVQQQAQADDSRCIAPRTACSITAVPPRHRLPLAHHCTPLVSSYTTPYPLSSLLRCHQLGHLSPHPDRAHHPVHGDQPSEALRLVHEQHIQPQPLGYHRRRAMVMPVTPAAPTAQMPLCRARPS